MSQEPPATGKVARDAAVSSLVSNAVYLAVMIALGVVLTRRDWVERQAQRLQTLARREWRGWHTARELAEFSRAVSEYDHAEIRPGNMPADIPPPGGDCGC